MAAVNIAATHVSASITKEFQTYGPENYTGEHIRNVVGTITVDVASGNTAVYTTAAKVPLTNLFDSTNASYLGLDASHIWGGTSVLATAGTDVYQAVISGGSTPVVTLYVVNGTGGAETGFDEMANTTDTGEQTITIPFFLTGRKDDL